MDENSMPEIYIGNLPSNIDEKSLEAAFSLCGKIVQEKTLVVNYRNLGVLRAYGFITFEDPASVKRAQGFIKSVLVDEKEHIGYPLVIYPAMEYRYRAEIAILEAVSEQEIINEIRKSYGWSFHECIQYKNRGNSVLVCVDFKSEQARQKFIRLGLRFQSEPATVRDHPKRTASIPRQQRPFTLYMCNIPPNTTEQDLRDMFKLCGPIETITIENVESYLKRGSIVFVTKQGSELAESFNGSLVNNWPAPIKLCRPCLGKYDAEADFPYGVRVRYFGSNVTLGDIEIKLCPSQIGSVKGVRPKDWESLGYLYVNFKNRELQEKALAMSGKLDLGGDRPAEFEPTERWVQSTVLVDDASHVRESIPQREFSQAQLNHSRKPTNNLHDRIYSVNNVFSRYCQVYTLQSDRRSLLETHKMQLTQNMRLDAVLPLLQAAGAIPDTVLETIKRYRGLQARRELLKAVEDHGDDAFESLYESFVSSKQYSLAALLQPLIKDDSNNVDPRHSLTPNSNQYSWIDKMPMELTGRLNLPVEGTDGLSVKNQLQIWRNNSSNIYKNFSSPKGRCLIINNHRFATMGDRKGTEIDCINAQKLFRELGYEVVIHNDLKAKAMIHELYIFLKIETTGIL